MCWAPSVGGDGVTTRRSALSKRPCNPARRSAAWHAGTGWLIACCSPGVDKCARGDRAEMLRLLLFPSRSRLWRLRSRAARHNRRLHRLRSVQELESSRLSSAAAVVFVGRDVDVRRCSRFLSSCDDDDPDSERRQRLDPLATPKCVAAYEAWLSQFRRT